MKRSSGILLPISALPSKYGIGNMGEYSAKNVAQFMIDSGQSVLNILPIYEMGDNSCPYSAISEVVSHVLIDPQGLFEYGITKRDIEMLEYSSDESNVDYPRVYKNISSLLSTAFSRQTEHIEHKEYEEHAIFMVAREVYGIYISNWPDDIRHRKANAIEEFKQKNYNRILYWEFVAWIAEEQYRKFKKILNENGILIYGDLPFYCDLNSNEVWLHPKAFEVDWMKLTMNYESGAAPDYFDENGQHWGTPCYREFSDDNVNPDFLDFWKDRIRTASTHYDILRLDHFRGIDSPWKWDVKTGKGKFYTGAGLELVNIIKQSSSIRIVAEDLGDLSYGNTRELLEKSEFPGIKVAAFGLLDPEGEHYPCNWSPNSVCYTGTHDNEALRKMLSCDENVNRVDILTRLGTDNTEDACWRIIESVMESKAQLVILSFVDIFDKPRYNLPGTVSDANWSVRLDKFSSEISARLNKMVIASKRK